MAAGNSPTEAESSIAEIKNLLQGLGYVVAQTIAQRRAPLGAPSVLGGGKLKELQDACEAMHAEWGVLPFLAFVSEISPSQQRLLERDFETVVLDRTGIILRVFESRARTRLSKLEIELARLIYGVPRMRDEKAQDDREGGGGRGARGNSNVELAKQGLRERSAEIRREIKIEQAHQRRRSSRRAEAPRVALVGYTNAGKSCWMRQLTGSDVLVEDKLFATLDTTVRAMQPDTVPRILISDTVGFIQDLPHSLVASFRSTLDEALDTDLLLYVVDGADANMEDHLKVTREVLKDVGATNIPSRLIINKADKIDDNRLLVLKEEFPDALFLSAHSDKDASTLRKELLRSFEDPMKEYSFDIEFANLGTLSQARQEARVVSEKFTETGVTITLLSNRVTLERLGLLSPPPRKKEAWEDESN